MSSLLTSRSALLLNASWEPLTVVSAKRAIVLVLQRKAEVLHESVHRVTSEKFAMAVPSVLRLLYYVHTPYRGRVGLNRKAIFARDGYRCQYCGGPAENIDHIVPRSRGGDHSWYNVVASCRKCNGKKENKTPEEAGMQLLSRPSVPHRKVILGASCGRIYPEWEEYFHLEAESA